MYTHFDHQMLIKDLYRYGKERLNLNSVSSAGLDAALLLNKVTGTGLIDLYVNPNKQVSIEEIDQYNKLLDKRISNEPMAYILGEKEFYSRMFTVNSNVLIPRPETELLVAQAINIIKKLEHPVIIDVGTGSGCIAVTVKAEVKNAVCVATDISYSALEITRKNAGKNNVHIELVNGDLLGIFKNNSIDIIVSNPPYVSEKDFTNLEKNVKDFEPRQALVSEDEGLYVIKQLVCNSKNILKKGGWVLIEIGYDQTEKVIGLFQHHGFKHIESIKDISGIDRVIKAQWIN